MIKFFSPIGELSLFASEKSLTHVRFSNLEYPELGVPELLSNEEILEQAVKELEEYFAGNRTVFTVPLDVSPATVFRGRVFDEISKIPYGGTSTYKNLSISLGSANFVRAVGSACRLNPLPIFIPCHRVLPSSEGIGQYLGGSEAKHLLLNIESVKQA